MHGFRGRSRIPALRRNAGQPGCENESALSTVIPEESVWITILKEQV